MKTAKQLADEMRASKSRYVTYGDGDLGVPVLRTEAIRDIERMEDHQIGEGAWEEYDHAKAIFDGILDEAASEYKDQNLKSAEAVQAYAENGLDVIISEDTAERIREVAITHLYDLEHSGRSGSSLLSDAYEKLEAISEDEVK